MSVKARIIIAMAISGLFLLADRWLKYLSLTLWHDKFLLSDYLGWLPFRNTGIAFGLPVPVWLTIALTAPFIFLVGFILVAQTASALQKNTTNIYLTLALTMIFLGGASNLADRLAYHSSLDYFLILTAVINVADVMIVAGFALLLFFYKKTPSLSSSEQIENSL